MERNFIKRKLDSEKHAPEGVPAASTAEEKTRMSAEPDNGSSPLYTLSWQEYVTCGIWCLRPEGPLLLTSHGEMLADAENRGGSQENGPQSSCTCSAQLHSLSRSAAP